MAYLTSLLNMEFTYLTVTQEPVSWSRPFALRTVIKSKKLKEFIFVYDDNQNIVISCQRNARRMFTWLEMRYGKEERGYIRIKNVDVDTFLGMVDEVEQMHGYIYSKARIK